MHTTYTRHDEADAPFKRSAYSAARQTSINCRSHHTQVEQLRVDRAELILKELYGADAVVSTFRKTMATVTVFANSTCNDAKSLRLLEEGWATNFGVKRVITDSCNTIYRFPKEQA